MITFINVFTVKPEKQQDAMQAIEKVYTQVVKHQPGFISAKLLKSHDGNRVTAVAEWETEAHLQAMRTTQEFKDLHDRNFDSGDRIQ
ncbi:MAG: antibiotic biosynthesis monooxygenase family protein [Xenococcaceae cyanobacterium]